MTFEEGRGYAYTHSGALGQEPAGGDATALGINHYTVANDYWADAVKACGGVHKLPSAEQLGDLTDYVFNTSGIGISNQSGLDFDNTKTVPLGFRFVNGL